MINIFLSRKAISSILLIGLLSGCTAKPQMYNWGSYESQLYARFTATTSPEQQIAELEKTLQTNKLNKPAPPGFHAHLGLLYGEIGRLDDMREQFAVEKQLFPESAAFMDFLLARSIAQKGKKS